MLDLFLEEELDPDCACSHLFVGFDTHRTGQRASGNEGA